MITILIDLVFEILISLITNSLNLKHTFKTLTFKLFNLLSKKVLSYDLLLSIDISISLSKILSNLISLSRCLLTKHIAKTLYFRDIRSLKYKLRVFTIAYIYIVFVIGLVEKSSNLNLSPEIRQFERISYRYI